MFVSKMWILLRLSVTLYKMFMDPFTFANNGVVYFIFH